MKSRVALVAVLALGVFMSGTGATLAVSGFAATGSASSTQYTNPNNDNQVVAGTTGKNDTCDSGTSGSNSASSNGSDSNCTEPEAAPAVEAQAVQQVAATSESGSSLPFTGFVAIPVLIIGLGLLAAGVVMRVRVRRGGHTA